MVEGDGLGHRGPAAAEQQDGDGEEHERCQRRAANSVPTHLIPPLVSNVKTLRQPFGRKREGRVKGCDATHLAPGPTWATGGVVLQGFSFFSAVISTLI
jgi:hypothetical protein